MTFATARVRRSTALLLAAGLLAGLLGAGGAGAATSTTTYTVNTALDSADGACTATNCSLREAILAANRRFGSSDVVKFKIPGALPATIHLGTSLPPVRDPVRIDGTTQPGYAGSPVIVVDGAGLGTAADGLRILRGATTVRGLWVTGFGKNGVFVQSPQPVTIERNRITANGGDGVSVISTSARILQNEIDANAGLAIDLGDDGVTANDPGDGDTGPNNLQNFPTVMSVGIGLARTVVRGALSSTPNRSFVVQLFRGDACDPSGHGEGSSVLASFAVATDGAGIGAFERSIPGRVAAGSVVTATATDAAGNTSELSSCGPTPVEIPPNVVLVLTDDQSLDTLPRSPAAMPWLQARMNDTADSWIRFTNDFTNVSLCCPSRATTFTGEFAHHHGVNDNAQGKRMDDDSTIATWLHDAGYRTGLIGKYLNRYPTFGGSGAPYVPPGWDAWVAFTGTPDYGAGNYTVFEAGKPAPNPYQPNAYSTDFLSQKAQGFMNAVPAGTPFFLELAVNAPHYPFTPLPPGRTFPDFGNVAGPSFNEANVDDKPQWVRNLPLANATEVQTLNQAHTNEFKALLAVDEAIHALVDTLTARGVLDDTVIVVTSDNGAAYGEHRWRNTDTDGDLPRKACPYDICTHVPLLVRVPGQVHRAEPSLVSNVDLAPTIADLAGVSPVAPVSFDGTSLLPLLLNQSPAEWRAGTLIEWGGTQFGIPAYWAVRTDRYLYVEYPGTGERELYDHQVDPAELVNRCPDPNLADGVGAYACDAGYLDEQADLQALLDSLKP